MKNVLKFAKYTVAQQSRLLKKLEKSKTLPKDVGRGVHYARVHVLRKEARALHLAHGFLRGRTMDEMELPLRPQNRGHISSHNMTRHAPDWKRIEEIVLLTGSYYFENDQDLQQAFEEFKDSWTVGNV